MKICLVSRGYPPEILFGGIETYVYNLAHGLTDLGHQVVILAETKKKTSIDMDGKIKIYRILTTEKSFFERRFKTMTYRLKLAKALRRIVAEEKIDIIEAPDNGALTFFYSSKNTPLVVRLHTPLFFFRKLNNYPPNNYKTKVIEWMEKRMIKKADALSSPSKMLAEIVSHTVDIEAGKIEIIPNLINVSLFKPAIQKINKLIVLYVGRLEKIKGTDILIEAIHKVDDQAFNAEFVLIGDSTLEFKQNIIEQIKKYHLENKVKLLGKIDYADLPVYYQKAALFVIPSRWDNFPGSCLEAEASGLPIVASAVGGLKEQLVREGKNGFLVPPGNANELANKISLLLNDSRLRQEMGQESLKIVKNNYQPFQVAKKMITFYRQIIKKRR